MFKHVSVLLDETIDLLNVKQGGLYLDGTLGGGGHSLEICRRGGRVIGVDRDENAIKAAKQRLSGYEIELIWDNFGNLELREKVDGVVLDLGVSSHQLDEAERGFSYRFDAPLDMRMNREDKLTAWDIVNEYDENDIAKIIFEYGEERNARRIAKRIVEGRPIDTTFELVEVIKSLGWQQGKHPAKRTFQAIRIAVNDELSQLPEVIKRFAEWLNPAGRIAIITFHSLEDRIVKTSFADLSKGCACPKGFPICVCGNEQKFQIITKKPIIAGEKELQENPRSASAKLRVLERL